MDSSITGFFLFLYMNSTASLSQCANKNIKCPIFFKCLHVINVFLHKNLVQSSEILKDVTLKCSVGWHPADCHKFDKINFNVFLELSSSVVHNLKVSQRIMILFGE